MVRPTRVLRKVGSAVVAKTSKAARRARAQAAQRAAEQRARQARRRRLLIGGAGAAVLVIAMVLALVVALKGSDTPAAKNTRTPATTAPAGGTGRTTLPPWDAPADATARTEAAGLPILSSEGNLVHIHVHLDVLVEGEAVAVPADIGVDQRSQRISPLHTHDGSGVVHVESPTKADFTLGQLFTEWDVALSADRIGGLRAGGGRLVRAYVDGKPYDGDPASIALHDHEEIAIVYGTAAQQKNPPSSYDFPAGG